LILANKDIKVAKNAEEVMPKVSMPRADVGLQEASSGGQHWVALSSHELSTR
jgi:hypothetical protein